MIEAISNPFDVMQGTTTGTCASMQMSQFQAFQCHYQRTKEEVREKGREFCQAISIVSAPNNLTAAIVYQ